MKKIFLALLISIAAFGACKPYVLGLETQGSKELINLKNSLVFKSSNKGWSVSSLQDKVNLKTLSCKDKAYVLINNDEISYDTPEYRDSFYSLKRGWNYIDSHMDGVDVEKTFKNSFGVIFVYVYDKPTQAWAGYSPQKNNLDMMLNTRILSLKKIEPNRGFYVYAKSSEKVNIVTTVQKGVCKTLMSDDNYAFLTDSGIDSDTQYNEKKSIGLKSRYFSHYKRGVYSESRITLIYPKIKVEKVAELKYGPAVPKSTIEYTKEYENLNFYMFDHKKGKCYQGIFPSMKTPPFASLKEMK